MWTKSVCTCIFVFCLFPARNFDLKKSEDMLRKVIKYTVILNII